MDAILNFIKDTGFYLLVENWQCLIMIGIACVLMFLAIVKKFEPLLLLPIAFGMLLTNLPGAGVYNEALFAGGHVNWDLFGGAQFVESIDLSADLVKQGAFQVLQDGSVALGQNLFGHLSGVSVNADAFINNLGQIVTANGEVLAESAKIVIDAAGLTVTDGVLYAGQTL
ncbi:MAG: sodium ion-translocating decarboxylase subunit beta, partial [Clostridia bacterium]|nr:sodium ion-translocating decarboxylase subunit beta [Clostridia bacterium]